MKCTMFFLNMYNAPHLKEGTIYVECKFVPRYIDAKQCKRAPKSLYFNSQREAIQELIILNIL